MAKLVMLRGLPASGKTTVARSKYPSYKRINKDDLRKMIDNGKYTPENEEAIDAIKYLMIQFYLARGHDVISDDCNLNPDHEKIYRHLCTQWKELFGTEDEFEVVDMNVSVIVCVTRDRRRLSGWVGEKAIRAMAEKYDYVFDAEKEE